MLRVEAVKEMKEKLYLENHIETVEVCLLLFFFDVSETQLQGIEVGLAMFLDRLIK